MEGKLLALYVTLKLPLQRQLQLFLLVLLIQSIVNRLLRVLIKQVLLSYMRLLLQLMRLLIEIPVLFYLLFVSGQLVQRFK